MAERRNSNSQLLQELDALSQTLYHPNTNRRHASLVIPRSAAPTAEAGNPVPAGDAPVISDHPRPRSRRRSMSPFRFRPKSHHAPDDDDSEPGSNRPHAPSKNQIPSVAAEHSGEKKGIWGWKPMRAISHIGMNRLGCLFSVEVVAVQGLPPSMNGLRLSVAVRKKETKDGAVKTMPARVLQGAADFEETLFLRCHVYCSGGAGTGKPLKFEPRPFLVSAVAVDAPELDFGKSFVDLSLMVKESMERSLEGARVRQWDTSFPLSGKARGGELVLKLGFQIMEDGGVGIYSQGGDGASLNKRGDSAIARNQSKSSFSVSSPKITRPEPSMAPSKEVDLKAIDDFNLDEPAAPPPPSSSPPATQKLEPEPKAGEEVDFLDFEVVDKGIEIQAEGKPEEKAGGEESADEAASNSSEVVKEVVHDSAHLIRMTELDAIAQQIRALESMVSGGADGLFDQPKTEQGEEEDDEMQRLDADEETVTREFLHMLELQGDEEFSFVDAAPAKPGAETGAGDGEAKTFLPDLGKGLGPLVQTRDGGYLTAMNPLDVQVARKETPKLAMQISRPIVLDDRELGGGFEVFQRLAAMGAEGLVTRLASLTAMDELMGKTAEQIAFEGIASAIISGRSKEGASSSAARSVAALKTMAAAMSDGRRERVQTGIWNVKAEPASIEEVLAMSLQKVEAMAVEGLKIQADMAEEEPPFEVSPLPAKESLLSSAAAASPPEDWARACDGAAAVTMLVVVQLREPLRRYEAVGAPMVAAVQAGGDGEGGFKVASLSVGGLRLRARGSWDGERQRLTAAQWLVAYGLGKGGRSGRRARAKGGQDLLWSLSSRVMADMWLKQMRNPDVKLPDKL